MRARLSSFTSVAVPFAAVTVTALFALAGCSGASDSVFPKADLPDSGTPLSETNEDAGSFFDGNLVQEAAATICDPQSIAGFKPTWTPPETWKQTACAAAQISGFYAACLTPPIDETTCKAYVAANSTCSACLQTEDTAPTSGAIVWHEHDAYWTVNVAGCLARATGDSSATGCGGSYSAAIACRQASCNACWAGQGTTTTFAEFSMCEQQAGESTCATYAAAVPAACGDISQGPGSVCMPASGATAQDAFMQIAPLFCGQ
jgi:hypothetical protein